MRALLLAATVFAVLVTAEPAGALGSSPVLRQVSPDRKWEVGYGRKNGYGRLDLTDRSTGRIYRMYRSNDACCEQITWVGPHSLVFVDDYRVMTLDPNARRVVRIASFSNFAVSPNGRWVAGWADSGGHAPETVHVVPIGGGPCLVVPRRPDQDDSGPRFSPDSSTVLVQRQRFDRQRGEPVGRPRVVGFRLSSLPAVPTC